MNPRATRPERRATCPGREGNQVSANVRAIPMVLMLLLGNRMLGVSTVPVAPGEQEFQASVSITYAIE